MKHTGFLMYSLYIYTIKEQLADNQYWSILINSDQCDYPIDQCDLPIYTRTSPGQRVSKHTTWPATRQALCAQENALASWRNHGRNITRGMCLALHTRHGAEGAHSGCYGRGWSISTESNNDFCGSDRDDGTGFGEVGRGGLKSTGQFKGTGFRDFGVLWMPGLH